MSVAEAGMLPGEVTVEHRQACGRANQWTPGVRLQRGLRPGETEPFTGLCPPGRRADQGGTVGPPQLLLLQVWSQKEGWAPSVLSSASSAPAPTKIPGLLTDSGGGAGVGWGLHVRLLQLLGHLQSPPPRAAAFCSSHGTARCPFCARVPPS